MTEFYSKVYRLPTNNEAKALLQDFAHLMNRVNEWHDQLHHEIYNDVNREHLQDNEISSLLNVNRELLNSNMALVMALQDYCLEEDEAAALGQLPGVR